VYSQPITISAAQFVDKSLASTSSGNPDVNTIEDNSAGPRRNLKASLLKTIAGPESYYQVAGLAGDPDVHTIKGH
jgi:hypothetical protein